MLVSKEWLERKYDEYNKLLFGGELPRIEFKIGRGIKTWGYASYRFDLYNGRITPLSITVSNYHDSPEEVKINTLIHEMIHIYDYARFPQHFIERDYSWNARYAYKRVRGYDAHGQWFRSECDRVNKFGFKVSVNVQQWEQDASTLSSNAQRLVDKKKAAGAIIGFSHKLNGEWFKVKTNDRGMNEYVRSVESNKEWYSRYYDLQEWYRTYDDFNVQLRNTTRRGWRYSDEKKNEEVSSKQMELIKKVIIKEDMTNVELTEEEKVETVRDMLVRLVNSLTTSSGWLRRGIGNSKETNEKLGLTMWLEVDKGKGTCYLNFSGVNSPLGMNFNVLWRDYLDNNCQKYGSVVYKYLVSKGVLREMKNNVDFKGIIREVVDKFVNDNVGEESENMPGMRRVTKEIGDGEFIEHIE